MRKTIIILSCIVAAFLFIVVFLRYYPPFGGNITKTDIADYSKRNSNFNEKQFTYPDEWKLDGLAENNLTSKKSTIPKDKLPVSTPNFNTADPEKIRFTWFGHSSILLQIGKTNILIDPIFCRRAFPFQWIGPHRFTKPSIKLSDLPHIDVVLLTHDHHDHLDPFTLKNIDSKIDKYIVPLGVDKHLTRWGISNDKINNKAWWESTEYANVTFTCTPSRHFSGRRLIDNNQTQWCSWVIQSAGYNIFDSGDGSIGKHFEEIHNRFGNFDLALMECGQYNDMWHYVHMYPEESIAASNTLGAKTIVPVHWCAFTMSTHAWDDPPERFVTAAEKSNLNVLTPHLCETVKLEEPNRYKNKWWRDYQ